MSRHSLAVCYIIHVVCEQLQSSSVYIIYVLILRNKHIIYDKTLFQKYVNVFVNLVI